MLSPIQDPTHPLTQPLLIDNINHTLRDDLMATIGKGSRISIAAASFSIYAFQELHQELLEISELRFVFTSPSFTTEKTDKQRREFYIPRLNRERDLFGSEFEIKLRNELSLKAVAKECADWIRKKACFKSNRTGEHMPGFINVDKVNYMPVNGFTTVDLGCERGNYAYQFVQRTESPYSEFYLSLFDRVWHDNERLQNVTEQVLDHISNAYRENSPEFIYFVTLYNIFNEFLEDISEDVLPNEATGFKQSIVWNKLYNFQKDAALAIINKLEKFNGCILADSVGLGKTFTAISVIKYYENRNKSVLVLCPKKLHDNWMTYRSNYVNNPLVADRLRYDILYHTDLSRRSGLSNGLDLQHINWSNYDLVVIDESHNFRNGGKITTDENDENPRENRYLQLMNRVIKKGVKTKVLMLSATPVNNRFNDLRNQLALAYEGDDRIGSKNEVIQLVNYWPDIDLDDYINLKGRVEARMKVSVMTATGDDNPLTDEEQGDLEYRRKQLERLQTEVIDLEEMNTGVSIMDLGLNEFRLDLLDYQKSDHDIEHTPMGLHAITVSDLDCPPGVVYVLKNRNNSVNIDRKNRLHPFYMVYISRDSEVIVDHLDPKGLLDKMRHLCRGRSEPILDLCRRFNAETRDGQRMGTYSRLLGDAISSLIKTKETTDLFSFLEGEPGSLFGNEVSGLDDFELICFLIITNDKER